MNTRVSMNLRHVGRQYIGISVNHRNASMALRNPSMPAR